MVKAILFCLLFHLPLAAGTFRNQAIVLPSVGYLKPDLTPEIFKLEPWPITSEITLGASYRFAFGYNWWVPVESLVGFGRFDDPTAAKKQTVVSLSIATGIRYDFLIQYLRPYVAIYLNYMQFFVPRATNNINIPINFGPKFGLGLEWVMFEDMGLQVEAGYALLFNIDDPVRQHIVGNVAYVIYF